MDETRKSDRQAPVPPASQSAPPPKQIAKPKENIKETIESILVAFILAFVFRAFVVEAFVIPSGSMATTLLGAHMRFRCQECGYDFTVNFPNNERHEENLTIPNRTGPGRAVSAHCPNCGFKVPRTLTNEYESATNSLVHYGDRILVLKYLYLLQEPTRWDVVVFKAPLLDPSTNDYTTNYIKRLVGKPGEAIMLLDGDVYVARNYVEGTPAESAAWEIQSKPRAVQETLWRVVYDNDYQPLNAAARPQKWRNPWTVRSGKGWNLGKGDESRIFHFDNAAGAEPGVIVFDKDANEGTHPFSDWLPYDETLPANNVSQMAYTEDAYGFEKAPRWYVSDLKLHFGYERTAGDGPLEASLSRLGHEFTARFEPGKVTLIYQKPDGTVSTAGQAALPAGGALDVEFTNVDYQVTVRVNGKNLIQTAFKPDLGYLLNQYHLRHDYANSPERSYDLASRQQRAEKIRSFFGPPTVRLSAARQSASISHLSLWRDIYYTPNNGDYTTPLHQGSPETPAVMHQRGRAPDGREYDNEYFVLGDNSILSLDARLWNKWVDLRANEDLYVEPGRVPERFLLGKAFFVYWPAGYRPFSPSAPGVVPNFGSMRIIH